MPGSLAKMQVSLAEAPVPRSIDHGPLEITLGDLHSHAMKLIYFLVTEGILNVPPDVYIQLWDLYHTLSNRVTNDIFKQFEECLSSKVTINRVDCLVRLLGDELADRGENDLFVLMIFKKLVDNNIKFEILFSNHGSEFLNYVTHFTKPNPSQFIFQLHEICTQSVQQLRKIVERGVLTKEALVSMVNTHYKPYIKLLSYSVDKASNEITIFSHAPIDINDIASCAAYYRIDYKDDTIDDITRVIDRLNRVVSEEILADTMHLHCYHICDFFTEITSPIKRCAWNRDIDSLHRPSVHPNNFFMRWVHGHDPKCTYATHVINLDNDLGKGPEYFEGQYTVYISRIVPSPTPDVARVLRPTGTFFSSVTPTDQHLSSIVLVPDQC